MTSMMISRCTPVSWVATALAVLASTASFAQTTSPSKRVRIGSKAQWFGRTLKELSVASETPLQVDPQSKVSGVFLFMSLKENRVEDVKNALASFFSHKGALSRWRSANGADHFLLSTNYGVNFDRAHWGRKMITLFDDVLKYADAPPEEKERLQSQRSLYQSLTHPYSIDCARLMSHVFDRATIEDILAGDGEATIDINSLTGENRRIADRLYQESLSGFAKRPAENPRLTFRMNRINKEIAGSLCIYTTGEDGSRVGGNYLGYSSEQEAKAEMSAFWLVQGDEAVAPDLSSLSRVERPANPSPRTVPIPHASFQGKFKAIAEHFDVPIIAVLPPAIASKELTLAPTLSETLASLADDAEPILFKKRNGILLICPASFFGDQGISSTLPLAVFDALEAAPFKTKDRFPSLIEYARLTASLSDAQLRSRTTPFPVLSVVQKWRPFLRTLLKQEEVAKRLESGEAVVMDNRLATAVNALLRADQSNQYGSVSAGDRLSLKESTESLLLDLETEKEMLKDSLRQRVIILTGTAPDGSQLFTLSTQYIAVNYKVFEKAAKKDP